jgi:hypothetical protein
MEFTIRTYQGEYDLSAHVRLIGEDLLVAIWGGEKPHIGAVAAAESRPSTQDPDQTSATVSVFCYLMHKEDDIAKVAAKRLSAALDTKVVVTAGIHWDNLSAEGIRKVNSNSEILILAVQGRIQSEREKGPSV